MATKRTRAMPVQKLDRDLMEQLLFGTGRARRFTQDSPVLPDVWLEYAKQPAAPHEGRPQGAARSGSAVGAASSVEAPAHAVPGCVGR